MLLQSGMVPEPGRASTQVVGCRIPCFGIGKTEPYAQQVLSPLQSGSLTSLVTLASELMEVFRGTIVLIP